MSRFAKLPHILHEAINDIGKGKHSARAQGVTGLWDYVKNKLGYKEPKKSIHVEEDPLPVHQRNEPKVEEETPLHEIWKPGYRGRTDNQRF